jgi:hypothetical protein
MPNNNYSELCTIGNITGYTLTNSIQIERERESSNIDNRSTSGLILQ